MRYINPFDIFSNTNIINCIVDHHDDASLRYIKKEISDAPYPGFKYILEVDSKKSTDQILLAILSILNRSMDDNLFTIAAYLGEILEILNRFINLRPSSSFRPRLFDLYNIQQALESYQPDLIIEIGGGVSSLIFSNYLKLNKINKSNYLLIDPSTEWAHDTQRCLSKLGFPQPTYLDLPVTTKPFPVHLKVMKKGGELLDIYSDFSYQNENLISALKNSKKPLFYIDGGVKGNIFQGAEIFLDSTIQALLSKALVLVDCRPNACNLLSTTPLSNIYSSNTTLIVNKKNYTQIPLSNKKGISDTACGDSIYPFEDLSFSCFQLN